MPSPKQLEFFPAKPPSAEERRALIRKRLEGFEYRQRAREQRRLAEAERRKARGAELPGDPQVTLEEMIGRLGG